MAYFSRKSRYDTLSDELWKERSEGTNLTLISPNFLCANTSAGRIVPRPRDIIPRNESKKSDPARDSESAPEPTPEGNTHKPRWKAYREHVYQYREEKGQNRDGKKNRYETHILDVLKSKDLTMHLDLNIVEDIEQDLDEFCRLARLGNFHAAKRFFFENLEEQMSNPYVFVQYAQMLLDMGNYAAIAGLRTPDGLDGIDMLRVNWNLVWLLAEIHIRGVSKHHVNHVATEAIELWSRRDPPGSTEVQILSLILRILAQRYSSDENHGVDVSFDWAGIYKQLLSEGRIWDFRDLFVAMLSYSGEHATCHCFLGVHFDSPALIDKLVRDWSTDTFDESISLALLDIIAFLCLAPGLTSGKYDAAKRCLEYSRRIASSLAENDAGLLMTGPYLRWSLAKARVATYITPEISGESTPLSFPSPQKTGQFLYRTWAIDIPLYVPIESELIDWKSITRPPYANDTIQIVLNAANQLGDYNTDALGRQLLVYRSQDPLKQFDELIALQTTVQLDMYGGLHTILGRYVMCKDENDRKNLRDEILADYNPEDLPSSLQRARTAVLRAISEPKLDNVVSDQEGSKSKDVGVQVQIMPTKHDEGGQPATSAAVGLTAVHDQAAPRPVIVEPENSDLHESVADVSVQSHRSEDSNGDGEDAVHQPEQSQPHTTSYVLPEAKPESPNLVRDISFNCTEASGRHRRADREIPEELDYSSAPLSPRLNKTRVRRLRSPSPPVIRRRIYGRPGRVVDSRSDGIGAPTYESDDEWYTDEEHPVDYRRQAPRRAASSSSGPRIALS